MSTRTSGGRAAPRAWLKRVLYRAGALGTYHRIRNRRHLTVAMFHRVLPAWDSRAAAADPQWTVSAGFFEDCLRFFVKHYQVVSLGDVLDHFERGRQLPARPLLITLDDGWADTEEYAARLLDKWKLPAVVFVVAGAIGGPELWQETVRRLWRLAAWRAAIREWARASTGCQACDGLAEVIAALSGLAPEKRRVALEMLQQTLACGSRNEMISSEQLQNLRAVGCAIGSHGLTHTSVTLAPDAWSELRQSRSMLARALEEAPEAGPRAFSFPNGRYNFDVARLARKAGYSCLFTSEGHLNAIPVRKGFPILGRVDIPARPNSGAAGGLRPELLACWLFLRPAVPVRYVEENCQSR